MTFDKILSNLINKSKTIGRFGQCHYTVKKVPICVGGAKYLAYISSLLHLHENLNVKCLSMKCMIFLSLNENAYLVCIVNT